MPSKKWKALIAQFNEPIGETSRIPDYNRAIRRTDRPVAQRSEYNETRSPPKTPDPIERNAYLYDDQEIAPYNHPDATRSPSTTRSSPNVSIAGISLSTSPNSHVEPWDLAVDRQTYLDYPIKQKPAEDVAKSKISVHSTQQNETLRLSEDFLNTLYRNISQHNPELLENARSSIAFAVETSHSLLASECRNALASLESLRSEMEKDRKRYAAEQEAMVKKHDEREHGLKTEREELSRVNKELQSRIDHRSEILDQRHARDLAVLRREYQNDVEERDAELKQQQQKFDAEIDAKLKQQQQKFDAELDAESKRQQLKFDHEIVERNRIHTEMLRVLQVEHASEKGYLIKQHDAEINALVEDHRREVQKYDSDLQKMTEIHHAKIGRMKGSMARELERMEREMEDLHSQLRAQQHEVAQMEKSMETKQEQKLYCMKKEIEELNSALRSQDISNSTSLSSLFNEEEFRGKSDEEIKVQFLNVVQAVEDLARRPWKREQVIWTDEILQKLNDKPNLRVLKKHILKNSIWTMLMYHIFSSPFRMFGEQGKVLETEWNLQFGKDPDFNNGVYTWPMPGVLAERWRYFTIRTCHNVTTKAMLSKWDSRLLLRKAYADNMNALISELGTMLGETVDLNSSDMDLIRGLARRSSIMWLEFQMYRCRIVISLPPGNLETMENKVKGVQEGSLDLAIVPSLGRYGDTTGGSFLYDFVVIGGLIGESVKIG